MSKHVPVDPVLGRDTLLARDDSLLLRLPFKNPGRNLQAFRASFTRSHTSLASLVTRQ